MTQAEIVRTYSDHALDLIVRDLDGSWIWSERLQAARNEIKRREQLELKEDIESEL